MLSLKIKYFLSLFLSIVLGLLLSCPPLANESCIAAHKLVSWAEATPLARTESLVALLCSGSLILCLFILVNEFGLVLSFRLARRKIILIYTLIILLRLLLLTLWGLATIVVQEFNLPDQTICSCWKGSIWKVLVQWFGLTGLWWNICLGVCIIFYSDLYGFVDVWSQAILFRWKLELLMDYVITSFIDYVVIGQSIVGKEILGVVWDHVILSILNEGLRFWIQLFLNLLGRFKILQRTTALSAYKACTARASFTARVFILAVWWVLAA